MYVFSFQPYTAHMIGELFNMYMHGFTELQYTVYLKKKITANQYAVQGG
jgi:virulence-associated protein VapD